jgi:YD repeat-containing protein
MASSTHTSATAPRRASSAFEHTARFEHGAIQLSPADGSTTRVETADTGLIKRRTSNGTTEVLQFNEAGLVAGFRYRRGRFGPHEARATRDAYSPEGDPLEVHDSEFGATRYETDAAHRLLAEHTPDGRRLWYGQDPAGNLVLVQVDVLGLDHPGKTDGADSATKKTGDVDGREGVAKKGAKSGTTPEQRALAAAPNAGPDGSSPAMIQPTPGHPRWRDPIQSDPRIIDWAELSREVEGYFGAWLDDATYQTVAEDELPDFPEDEDDVTHLRI